MTAPLIVTRDETLLDELLRLSAAAGVVPDVACDGSAALRGWASAPVVLLGADVADELAGVGPPRRPRVHIVSWGGVAHEMFRTALTVGAENVAELPRSDSWVIEVLSDLEEAAVGLTVGVIGGSGGAGATTFACALGQVAARTGLSVVIDTDPFGAGLDRVLGCERLAGVRWDALQQTTGRLSAKSLRDALPRRKGLGVLTWSSGQPGTVQAFAVREALSAAQRGHDVVVVDLPRRIDAVLEEVVSRCDHLFVVVQPTVVGIASAVRVCSRVGSDRAMSLVVRRPGIDAREVGRVIGLPVAVEMSDQRGLAEAIDLGAGPVRSFRGPLGKAAGAALNDVRQAIAPRASA
jgi:secretion/DNA translocation related CpaE-like protein